MAYSQRYDLLAQQIAREVFGDSALGQVFYRMMKQESGFDTDVVEGRRASSAGARGIAQFMPATAQEQGVDPMNPEQALRGAAAYLQKLIAYFGGDVAKGVAAYNAGAGRVEKAVAAGGANWAASLPRETQSYLQITQAGGTAMNGQDFPLGGGPMTPSAGAGGGTAASDVIPWLAQFFRDIPGDPPYTAYEQASDLFYEDPMKAISLWRSETGQEAGTTEAERARTAYDWAVANKLIAELGGDTYEQGRQRILDKIDQENWTADQAIDEFNAWMSAALEAGRRGEKVYGEQMERAAWTTPGEYYPGTEPGGARAQFAERHGVEFTPSPGVPVSQLPDPEQMYSKWHQNMGISQQAPPTAGGWSGQGQGAGQGKGYDAAMAFLQRMNLRQGAR